MTPDTDQMIAAAIGDSATGQSASGESASGESATGGPTGEGGTGQSGAPGAAPSSDNPAPPTDSESDPFAKAPSVVFRAGRVEARMGRKIKTVRPRLSLAGQYDVAGAGQISAVFGVHIDANGNVTQIDLLRSSGSNEIDLPCRRALQQWWIEPPKDKNGKPMPDVLVIKLSFE